MTQHSGQLEYTWDSDRYGVSIQAVIYWTADVDTSGDETTPNAPPEVEVVMVNVVDVCDELHDAAIGGANLIDAEHVLRGLAGFLLLEEINNRNGKTWQVIEEQILEAVSA